MNDESSTNSQPANIDAAADTAAVETDLNSTENSLKKNIIPSQVFVHAPVPELDLLRVGTTPEIYSSRRGSQRSTNRTFDDSQSLSGSTTTRRIFRKDPFGVSLVKLPETVSSARKPNPRFSTKTQREIILDETIPGDIPRTSVTTSHSARLAKKSKKQQSKLVSEFRQTADFTEAMEEKLQAYDNAKRLKTLVHNQDYEDHFLIPLNKRIKEKMAPENYNTYLQRKAEMIRNIDRDPVPINATPRKLCPVPHMNISTQGLKDPSLKYSEHQAAEKKLSRFIMAANGEKVRELKIPPPDTLNYKKLNLQTQTRFFFGNDPQANKKGRKTFKCWDASDVGNELDYFHQ